MDLGTQLKTYRKSKGHSVQRVSEITGIPADRIYKWEKGTRPSDAEDLLKIREYMAGKLERGQKENGKLESDPTPDLPPDTKQLYERWLADKEKTQQQFHATNQGLIDLLKNKLDEIATNLMTGQHQLKEQLFAVGESLGQQLDGISSGLAAKDRPVEQPVKKDKGVSGRQRESDGKDKSH